MSLIVGKHNEPGPFLSAAELAHAMGMKVIAEGVEQPGQLEFIQSLHSEEYQGYLFSPLLPADEAVCLLG